MIDLSPFDSPRGQRPLSVPPRRDERVVHVHLDAPGEPQHSLCNALASLGAGYQRDGTYRAIHWPRINNDDRRQAAIMAAVHEVKPTLVWMQLQTPGIVTPGLIARIRESSPEAVIVSWCGDIGRDPAWSHQLGPHVDALLFSSMTQAREHRAAGFPNSAYLQIGYDEAYHVASPHGVDGRLPQIAFFGQNYNDRHWRLLDHEAQLRRDVVHAMLEAELPLKLFGANWSRPPARGALGPRESAFVYRSSQLALSISLTSKMERYTSDRLFRALACGCAVLVKRFDDMEALGLQDGFNCMVFDTATEAVEVARTMLLGDPDGDIAGVLATAGAQLAQTEHTWSQRMAEQQVYLDAIRVERKG